MSLHVLKGLQDEVLQRAGLGEESRDLATGWINEARRDITDEHDWKELETVATFNTVANYNTGTVSLALDGTAITGAGTVFPAGSVGRKFSAGFGKPHFDIGTYTNGTTIALSSAWPFAALSADTYEIYEDVYSLADDVDKLFVDRITLHDDNGRELTRMTQQRFTGAWDLPTGAASPQYFTQIENDSTKHIQLQLGPDAPDAVYIVRYAYKKRLVDMAGPGAETGLDDDLSELIALGALIRAFELPQHSDTDKSERQEARFWRKLDKKIKNRGSRQGPRSVRPKTFDEQPTGRRSWRFNYPVAEA